MYTAAGARSPLLEELVLLLVLDGVAEEADGVKLVDRHALKVALHHLDQVALGADVLRVDHLCACCLECAGRKRSGKREQVRFRDWCLGEGARARQRLEMGWASSER